MRYFDIEVFFFFLRKKIIIFQGKNFLFVCLFVSSLNISFTFKNIKNIVVKSMNGMYVCCTKVNLIIYLKFNV